MSFCLGKEREANSEEDKVRKKKSWIATIYHSFLFKTTKSLLWPLCWITIEDTMNQEWWLKKNLVIKQKTKVDGSLEKQTSTDLFIYSIFNNQIAYIYWPEEGLKKKKGWMWKQTGSCWRSSGHSGSYLSFWSTKDWEREIVTPHGSQISNSYRPHKFWLFIYRDICRGKYLSLSTRIQTSLFYGD